jgi:hypothetical protein
MCFTTSHTGNDERRIDMPSKELTIGLDVSIINLWHRGVREEVFVEDGGTAINHFERFYIFVEADINMILFTILNLT